MSLKQVGEDQLFDQFIKRTIIFGKPPKETTAIALFHHENDAHLFMKSNNIRGNYYLLGMTTKQALKEFLQGQLSQGTEQAFIDPLEANAGDGLPIQEILNNLGE